MTKKQYITQSWRKKKTKSSKRTALISI